MADERPTTKPVGVRGDPPDPSVVVTGTASEDSEDGVCVMASVATQAVKVTLSGLRPHRRNAVRRVDPGSHEPEDGPSFVFSVQVLSAVGLRLAAVRPETALVRPCTAVPGG